MLKYFIKKSVGGNKFFRPKIMICVPSGVTEVEKRAVIEAATHAGGKSVFLMEEPIAAAIGAGLDISEPDGKMVVDVGGGTTDVAVMSLGTIVESSSVKIAGDELDEAIIKYMRQEHKLYIGERTAEEMKIRVGTAFPLEEPIRYECKGRDLVTGLPKAIVVTSEQMMEALNDPLQVITETIHEVLEKTPPELGADITENGIMLTGGGALLNGLDKRIESRTHIKVHIADDPKTCVAVGTGKALNSLEAIERNNLNKQ